MYCFRIENAYTQSGLIANPTELFAACAVRTMSKGFIRTNISFTLTNKGFTLMSKGDIYSFRWRQNDFIPRLN